MTKKTTKGLFNEYEVSNNEKDIADECRNQCHKCCRCDFGQTYMQLVGGY